MGPEEQQRVLVIDDNRAIHEDIRKVLSGPSAVERDLEALEAGIFGAEQGAEQGTEQGAEQGAGPGAAPGAEPGAEQKAAAATFAIDSAFQGEEGLLLLQAALAEGRPYRVAFVDMRMPPGWDGLTTIRNLWQHDPDLQVVICTAYSDCSWSQITAALGRSDSLLVLKKPFDNIEVVQLAHALCAKWGLRRRVHAQLQELEARVLERTRALEQANARLQQELQDNARMQDELRLAERLASVGTLAAGIAHEINTPVQFVSDNLTFLRDGFAGALKSLACATPLCDAPAAAESPGLDALRAALRESDIPFLAEQVPPAFESAAEGLSRIAVIVRALREFAHPAGRDKAICDLNRALRTTLTIATSEYRRVADLETDLGELPPVLCHVDEVNQALLNLIVNAAQAIGEKNDGGRRGLLRVTSRREGDDVVISIADSGCGIPAAIRERIFDPFFTTKPVGRGSGQGLGIARSVIVDKHGGSLTFESEPGKGTTFFVRLPIG